MTAVSIPRRNGWEDVRAPDGSDLALLFDALERAGSVVGGSIREGAGVRVSCPVHEDGNPSLDIEVGRSRPFVVNCKPCEATFGPGQAKRYFATLTEKLGLAPRDLRGVRAEVEQCDMGPAYAGTGGSAVSGVKVDMKLATIHYYRHANGDKNFRVRRLEETPESFAARGGAGKRRKAPIPSRIHPITREWHKGLREGGPFDAPVERTPYYFEKFEEWANGPIWLVEGETTADALVAAGVAATTFHGGANAPVEPDWATRFGFDRFKKVLFCADRDEPGRALMARLRSDAKAAGAPVGGIYQVPEAFGEGADAADYLAVHREPGAWIRKRLEPVRAAGDALRGTVPPGPGTYPLAGGGVVVVTTRTWDLGAEEQRIYVAPDGLVSTLMVPSGASLEYTVELAAKEGGSSAPDWSPADLGPYLDGTIKRPTPTLGIRFDGAALFYAGRVNVLFGEPEGGKTWVALAILAERLLAGEVVAFIDYEDDAAGAISRLRKLHVPDEAIRSRLRYVNPEQIDKEGVLQLVDGCSLVIIDATTEAMSAEGLNDNASVDVAKFYASLPKLIARQGPGVVLIDHVTKAHEGQNQQAGSQHKRAGVDGTSIKVENVIPFAPGGTGKSRLIVTKDRNGCVREKSLAIGQSRNALFADFFLPAEGGWEIAEPLAIVTTGVDRAAAKIAELEEAVVEIAESGGRPMNSVRGVISALQAAGVRFTKADVCKPFLDRLVDEGKLAAGYGPVGGKK